LQTTTRKSHPQCRDVFHLEWKSIHERAFLDQTHPTHNMKTVLKKHFFLSNRKNKMGFFTFYYPNRK
jgi:hypothetical protein